MSRLDVNWKVETPAGNSSPADELIDLLQAAAPDAARELSSRWPRRSGRSAGGFADEKTREGADVVNPVPYSAHVHAPGNTTPLADTLVPQVYGEHIAKQAEKRADDVASAVVRELLEPLKRGGHG